ncbi:elongation factor 1-beta-like [Liolophura sinensis]|uniref:elongation factor 1-beta-like n=1 Tax=Liolophura sinensis TaxID=3198878 RepID=UPI00315913C9
MGFGDLKSNQGLQALNSYLEDRSYIEGYVPSQADAVVFDALSSAPPANLMHALRWYNHIKSYGSEKSSFPGQKKDVSAYGSAAANNASGDAGDDGDDDDDDFDLFGDDADAEAAQQKLREERKAEAEAKKAGGKKGVIAKSSVVLYVKPWDDETDMKEVERLVRGVEMDGLLWGTSKLVPVGYGINKLQIACVIEDAKVSMDDLQEQIESFEDLVQSTDIASFNKV